MICYETIFITKPTLTDHEIEEFTKKTSALIEKNQGQILKTENWGRKKLAYEVEKEKKGNYVFINFNSPASLISELVHHYKITDAVIKYMTVNIGKAKTIESINAEIKKAEEAAAAAKAAAEKGQNEE